jgi:hypothetical protein
MPLFSAPLGEIRSERAMSTVPINVRIIPTLFASLAAFSIIQLIGPPGLHV